MPAVVGSLQGPACTLARGAQNGARVVQHAGRSSQPRRQRLHGRRTTAVTAAALLPLGPLADAADAVALSGGLDVQSWVLPAAGLGVVLAGVAALRFTSYSQLEYITAAMLARHVKPVGARVLQLGGTTRDLYYYPAGTVQVTVGGPDNNLGLWDQAGVQAKVPVVVLKQDVQRVLSTQAGSTFDSIVVVNQLQQWADPQQLLSQVYRVLKPGGTFVFVQRMRGGPLQLLLGGSGNAVDPAVMAAVQEYRGWDFVQWDAALEGTDPHAVGVAIKPLAAGGAGGPPGASVDSVAFEQMMKRNSGKRNKQQAKAQQQQQQRPGQK